MEAPDITEEGKYYTPDISEFHVGFEYEFNGPSLVFPWEKADIKDLQQIADIHQIFRGTPQYLIRVKHLDHDDIIAEGWQIDHNAGNDERHRYYVKGEHEMYFGFSEMEIEIYYGEYDPIFCGIIRNRSELKRIMKQVGIKAESKTE